MQLVPTKREFSILATFSLSAALAFLASFVLNTEWFGALVAFAVIFGFFVSVEASSRKEKPVP